MIAVPGVANGKEAGKVWFKPFARLGYAARGLVYSVIGVFAIFAALGTGESVGSHEALERLMVSGFGGVVAIGLMAGMVSFALWRLIQALFDTDRHGLGLKGLAVRAGLLASAGSYLVLALYTFGLWRGSGGGESGGGNVATAIAGVIGSQYTAIGLAIIFAGVGIAHIVKAVKKGYQRHFKVSHQVMKAVHPIARIGLTARGLVFLILAFLFLFRGVSAGEESGGTPGMEAALTFLESLPAGALLIGAMGAGLVCFALYSFLEAIWRRINVEDADA